MRTIKLFCIPYSGGTASIYQKWKKSLSSNIQVCPIELAGRGKRILEPLYDNADEAAEDIASIILARLEKDDIYAIWGHSMGSLLAYEVYYKLLKKEIQPPCHMFFSGRKAPHNMEGKTSYYLLSDDDFLEVVNCYGGGTKAVMENNELRKLFVPILRSDFKVSETYIHKSKDTKILCDMTVINGESDLSVRGFDMSEWSTCTEKKCDIKMVAGNHFFLLKIAFLSQIC